MSTIALPLQEPAAGTVRRGLELLAQNAGLSGIGPRYEPCERYALQVQPFMERRSC